jgi:hypothetical protein
MDKFYFDVLQNIDRALFYPHGPENKVSKGMVSGFIRHYQSLINLILDKRVISGKLLQFLTSITVCSAVTYMPNNKSFRVDVWNSAVQPIPLWRGFMATFILIYYNIKVIVKNLPCQFNYKVALEDDLPIGSGRVESAHRYVIQDRLKIAGAWWKENNAQNMLALRTLRANSDWENYWDQNIKKAA